MDISHDRHTGGANITAAYPTPVSEAARRFGVIQVDGDFRITDFEEKPAEPTPIPGRGIRTRLGGQLHLLARGAGRTPNADARRPDSATTSARTCCRSRRARLNLYAYDFARNPIPGSRTQHLLAGRGDARLLQANMDRWRWCGSTCSTRRGRCAPRLNTAHQRSSFTTWMTGAPALNSLLAGGVIISGGTVRIRCWRGACGCTRTAASSAAFCSTT